MYYATTFNQLGQEGQTPNTDLASLNFNWQKWPFSAPQTHL
jgi:hypothetical protein